MEVGEGITLENIDEMSEIITGFILRSRIVEIVNRDQAYILASVIVHGICSLEESEAAKEEAPPLQAVSHRLRKETVEELDRLAAVGNYRSRSDVIREIVESGIQKCREG